MGLQANNKLGVDRGLPPTPVKASLATKIPLDIIDLTDSDTDDCPDGTATLAVVKSHTCSGGRAGPKTPVRKYKVETKVIVLDSESEVENTVNDVDEGGDESDDDCVQPRFVPKTPRSRRAVVVSDSEDDSQHEHNEQNGIDNIDDSEPDKEAILELNDPPQSRKPLSRIIPSSISSPLNDSFGGDNFSFLYLTQEVTVSPTKTNSVVNQPKPRPKARKPKETTKQPTETFRNDALALPSTPASPSKYASPSKKRMTKKELERQAQARLEAYAQTLFDELNKLVFQSQLPADTALMWNKRLLTTAGRARWHRSKENVETSSIELSTKILDCEERIRNTLSHEMCHLASWVIDRKADEAHGRVWKAWTRKVMKKRPDIHINTRHSYDIAHKYEWQCQTPTCGKIYGRHSNSIDTKKQVCGLCKKGDLLPLFTIRTRTVKAGNKLSADTPQESPSNIDKLMAQLPGRLDDLHLDQSSRTKSSSREDDINDPFKPRSLPSIPNSKPNSSESVLGKLLAQLSHIELN